MGSVARTPQIRGTNVAASGTATLTWVATGVMGILAINNLGPGKVALSLGASAPANTTPATDVLVLASGDKVTFDNIELDQVVSLRADATVGGADVSAYAQPYPESG